MGKNFAAGTTRSAHLGMINATRSTVMKAIDAAEGLGMDSYPGIISLFANFEYFIFVFKQQHLSSL